MANLKGISRLGSLAELAKKTKALAAEEPENKRFRLLRIDEVVSHDQVRKSFDDLDDLAASIKELGVQVPINVRERDRDGHYVILQGERRWRAAKLAGLTKIPAIVDESAIDEEKRMLMQLTENIQRDDMRPLEIAKAFRALTDVGLTAAKIAKRLGRSHQFVSTYLHLNELPEFLYRIAEEGSIKDATTLLLLKRACDASPEDAEKIILDALDENRSITRSAAQKLLQRMKARNEEEDQPSAGESAESEIAPANAQTGWQPQSENGSAGTETSAAEVSSGRSSVAEADVPNSTEPGGSAAKQPNEAVRHGADAAHGDGDEEPKAQEATAGVPSGIAGKIRLVPVNSLRIVVEVLTTRDGQTTVEEGWLANNAVPSEDGMFCVMIDHDGHTEMRLVAVDEIDLKRMTAVSEG